MKCKTKSNAVLILCVCSCLSLNGQSLKTPSSVVQQLHSSLLSAMKDFQKSEYEERYERLAPAIRSTHRFPTIAKIVLGKVWKQLDLEKRKQFIEKFTDLSISTYVNQFKEFNGEEFSILQDETLKANRALVKSILKIPEGAEFQFNYILNFKDNEWKIINVIVDGVSDLALKRAEYSSVVKAEGVEALFEQIESKTAKNKTNKKD